MDGLVLAAAAVELADDGYAGDDDMLGATTSAPGVRKTRRPRMEETSMDTTHDPELPEDHDHGAARSKVLSARKITASMP